MRKQLSSIASKPTPDREATKTCLREFKRVHDILGKLFTRAKQHTRVEGALHSKKEQHPQETMTHDECQHQQKAASTPTDISIMSCTGPSSLHCSELRLQCILEFTMDEAFILVSANVCHDPIPALEKTSTRTACNSTSSRTSSVTILRAQAYQASAPVETTCNSTSSRTNMTATTTHGSATILPSARTSHTMSSCCIRAIDIVAIMFVTVWHRHHRNYSWCLCHRCRRHHVHHCRIHGHDVVNCSIVIPSPSPSPSPFSVSVPSSRHRHANHEPFVNHAFED